MLHLLLAAVLSGNLIADDLETSNFKALKQYPDDMCLIRVLNEAYWDKSAFGPALAWWLLSGY